MSFNTYFTAREILGYGALWNLVLSDRSDGKTFNCKVRALEDYERAHETTLYVRRYDSEITPKMYNSFMNEVFEVEEFAHYGDKYEFKHSKAGVEIRPAGSEKNAPWDWLFYFIPLSKAGKLKSQLDITHIRTIDYDEYMPLDHRYLKDEMLLLAELWKSIDRDRDRTQVILLGNRIDPFCPFLSYFNIDISIDQPKLRLYRDNTLAIQIYANKEHRAQRKKSKFARLMAGTPYEEYDQGGILYNAHLDVRRLPRNANPIFSFISEGKEGTIWLGDDLYFSAVKRKDLVVLVDDMSKAKNDGRDYLHASQANGPLRNYYYTNRLHMTAPELQPSVMTILRSR